jgi:hypothetical protein
MDTNELIVAGAAIALQLITIWLWRSARADADAHRVMFIATWNQLAELSRTSVRRDPKTGRYVSNAGKVIEL